MFKIEYSEYGNRKEKRVDTLEQVWKEYDRLLRADRVYNIDIWEKVHFTNTDNPIDFAE